MITVYPDYYPAFHCIADRCRHTCCAGWEIDVDEDSFARYRADGLPGLSDEETPHFVLTADERCPFLNDDNLCRLILTRGEGYLCQICRDHPRFRNYWTGITEIGLGLCCEAAASLILGAEHPMRLCCEDGELDEAVAALPEDERCLWLLRSQLLERAAAIEDPIISRLTGYLIFRHLPDALYDGRLEERAALADAAVETIRRRRSAIPGPNFEAFCEAARAWSDAVEYDSDEFEALLNRLSSDGAS